MPLLEQLTAAVGDRYRVERELGQGGMAVVFLAEDLKHRRRGALKVLKPELSAALQHPHILPLFDSGDAGGLLWSRPPHHSTADFWSYPANPGQSTMNTVAPVAVRDRCGSVSSAT